MIKQNAHDTKQIADKLGITLILDCGSLLGAYRDKAPIKGDEDDLDFAVDYDVMQFKMKEVIDAFIEKGFELHRLRSTVMSFKRGGNHVDLLFYEDAYSCYYLTLYHKKEAHALLTLNHNAYDELGTIEFLGETFACPKDIESHLSFRYGDWKTPILRPAFSFQNYIDSKVMIKKDE